MPLARPVFDRIRGKLEESITGMTGVDLVVAGAESGRKGRSIGQRGGSFGDRLRTAFRDAATLGYRKIIAVPIDVPGLGAAEIREALDALDDRPVVLGPSPDGGVYLLGVRCDALDLLRNIAWKTPAVFLQLCRNAVDPAILAPLADLDERDDFAAAADDPGLDPVLRLLIMEVSVPPAAPAADPCRAPAFPERSAAPPRAPPLLSAA